MQCLSLFCFSELVNVSNKTNIYNVAYTNNKKAKEAKITVFMKNSDLDIRRGTFKSLRAV